MKTSLAPHPNFWRPKLANRWGARCSAGALTDHCYYLTISKPIQGSLNEGGALRRDGALRRGGAQSQFPTPVAASERDMAM